MTHNPNKTKTIRDLGPIDISPIKQLIASVSDQVWKKETEERENKFECFHHTEHIIFRFPDKTTERMQVHDNPAWWVWKPHLLPLMEAAVAPYNYKNGSFKAVMLAKLKAGYGIDMHKDGLPEYYFLHKIHIPIETNDQVEFYIKPHTYFLKEGRAYEVNNLEPHYVKNNGAEDRIHLIFEYVDMTD